MTARTKARKRAVDLLFEADQRPGTDLLDLVAERLRLPGAETPVPEYAVEIAEGVHAHAARIDEIISTYSRDWALSRMPAVDRAVLRAAVWEILFNDEVPDAVAISEAVALAAELSTDDSPKFVNGLLSRVAALKPALLA